jgi:hypothetical protein
MKGDIKMVVEGRHNMLVQELSLTKIGLIPDITLIENWNTHFAKLILFQYQLPELNWLYENLSTDKDTHFFIWISRQGPSLICYSAVLNNGLEK